MKYLSREYLKNCTFCTDRYDAISSISVPLKKIAEVGVLGGDFSQWIYNKLKPEELHLIDLFNCQDSPDEARFSASDHLEFVHQRFQEEIRQGTIHLKPGLSWDVLATYPDNFFDLIYIDAAHDYDSVKKDLTQAVQKIAPHGRIMLNDYIMYDHLGNSYYGVVQATNEFCIQYGWEFEYFAFHRNLFCDVVLKKMDV